MSSTAKFAEIAALAGDPTRAGMLQALMDGRALTATELSKAAGVTPQTTSGHLRRLIESGLVEVSKQGRHRYHRLASPTIAQMLEILMQIALDLSPARRIFVGPRDAALRQARTCYDHLAGRLGVALADAMTARDYIVLTSEAGFVTGPGLEFLAGFGLDVTGLAGGRPASRQLPCRPCLDWSERRPHLGGKVGAALCRHSLQEGWVRRMDGTRAIEITPKGWQVFHQSFGLSIGEIASQPH